MLSHEGSRWVAGKARARVRSMPIRTLGTALLVLLLLGCDREREPVKRPPPSKAAAAEPPSVPDDSSFRFAAAARIVAIGDLHGDLAATRGALRLAGAIDDKDTWVGGELVVVQTGDQLDRGDDEPEIMDLLESLTKQAKASGGALHVLNGNHEVMNVAGDLRYVTEDGFVDYREVKPVGRAMQQQVLALDEKMRGRAAAFLPGGPEAKRLAKQNIAIVVGDTVFVHGGVLPGHAQYGIGKINSEARAWMNGETRRIPTQLDGPNSPIWSRDYSEDPTQARACEALGRTLRMLSAKRMVVGHTPQKSGITHACDKAVWRVDVGLAKHYGGQVSVLEIRGDDVRPLTTETP